MTDSRATRLLKAIEGPEVTLIGLVAYRGRLLNDCSRDELANIVNELWNRLNACRRVALEMKEDEDDDTPQLP